MADSTEVIQQQMEETRSRLAENLDKLGKQTLGTVEAVTSTVSDTVGAVQESVQTVTDTVQKTVENVKDTFDISAQTQRNPWLMLGGSVAVGYLIGSLLPTPSQVATSVGGSIPDSSPRGGEGNRLSGYWGEEHRQPQQPQQSQSTQSDWLDSVAKMFAPAIDKLKGMAISATLSVARDALAQPLGGDLGKQLSEVFDDMTKRMGGQPLPPSDKQDNKNESGDQNSGNAKKGHEHDEQRNPTKMDRPVGTSRR